MILKRFVNSLTSLALVQTKKFHGMDVVSKIKTLIPIPDDNYYKGQMGKLCIVGGSKEYTGAPYFAAISTLKLGGDLAHVLCPPEAAPIIKSYSPELMVHPLLDKKCNFGEITKLIERMHVVIIGPGLGREKDNMIMTLRIIKLAKDMNKPIVIDADGLYAITNNIDIIIGYKKAVLTPNANEFKNLYSKLIKESTSFDASEEDVKDLAIKLDGVCICRKAKHDIISDGENVLVCNHKGSPRRCGGQGDLLSGTMGVFIHWFFWKNHELSDYADKPCEDKYMGKRDEISNIMLAAYAACMTVKEANSLAYRKKQMSTLTTDMLEEIYNATIMLKQITK